MFDYLLKQLASKQQAPEQQSDENKVEAQKQVSQAAKLEALLIADRFSENEEEILAFIMQCSFADARFIAAQKIHSRAMLEKVREVMRKTDRRVFRLMQTRIDELGRLEEYQRQGRECIEEAQKLLNESQITPNLVANLDRRWQPVSNLSDIDQEILDAFNTARKEIDARLTQQTGMQRSVIDCTDHMQRIKSEQNNMDPDERERQFNQLESRIKTYRASKEFASLPRHLLASFEQAFQELADTADTHQRDHNAWLEREKILSNWEAEPHLNPEQIKRQWESLPEPDTAKMPGLQARFNALIQKASLQKVASPEKKTKTSQENKGSFTEHLEGLEKAIKEGAVQFASQHDEAIGKLDIPALQLSAEETERLQTARNEMRHLKGWARWSGQIAYDELTRQVEALSTSELSADQLTSAIAEARQSWKKLNSTAGFAQRSQWQKFHDACNRAYEPVLNQTRQAAEQRSQNAILAQSLVDRIREFVSGTDLAQPEQNWKKLALFYRNMMNEWRQLGQINRKDKKRLDNEFDQLILPLREGVSQRTIEEIAQREKLIEKARQIDAEDRLAGKMLKDIQEEWQAHARAFPLENRDDKKLWQRFRKVCEGIHTKRMKAHEVADGERLRNLQLKQAICERLESEKQSEIKELNEMLHKANEEWGVIGFVPKNQENAISDRYRKAKESIQKQIQKHKNQNKHQQLQTFIEKLKLCQQLEIAISQSEEPNQNWVERWQSLPSLGNQQENQLRTRWEEGVKALHEGNRQYAARIEKNREQLLMGLLHLEIAMGLDSPPEYAQERLKAQIEVLQESLSGNRAQPHQKRLEALCQLPALTDEETAKRLHALLKKEA